MFVARSVLFVVHCLLLNNTLRASGALRSSPDAFRVCGAPRRAPEVIFRIHPGCFLVIFFGFGPSLEIGENVGRCHSLERKNEEKVDFRDSAQRFSDRDRGAYGQEKCTLFRSVPGPGNAWKRYELPGKVARRRPERGK